MATTPTSPYLNRKAPGVYITETPAFSNAVVGVATAVPLFVGYTEFAGDPDTGKPLYLTPVAVSSMAQFQKCFGQAYQPSFSVALHPLENPAPSTPPAAPTPDETTPLFTFTADFTHDGAVAPRRLSVIPAGKSQFGLFRALQLFFANGGGDCYVVSVGSYWRGQYPTARPAPSTDWGPGPLMAGDEGAKIEAGAAVGGAAGLLAGLAAAACQYGPTMTVVPEACRLDAADYAAVAQAMLAQAASLQDRVAILDLPGCLTATTPRELEASQAAFTKAIAPQLANVSYGVAYAPGLRTSLIAPGELDIPRLFPAKADREVLRNLMRTEAKALFGGADLRALERQIATALPLEDPESQTSSPPDTGAEALKGLRRVLPGIERLVGALVHALDVAPPSPALAGVWTLSDTQNGVWSAPANLTVAAVTSPLCALTDSEQAGYASPADGQAINILRDFAGRGTVVWGARTLDGNSEDYAYIQVRRSLITIEQSIKLALQSYVFAANDATTWSTVTASISSFLTGLWQQGALMGASAAEAFTVQCGLGSTMTAQTVLDGYMVVAVTLQMVHPAEFMELTFTQTMGS
jgi:phage tail sheath protein FI